MTTTTTDPLNALLAIRNGYSTARWNFAAVINETVNSLTGIGTAVEVTYSFPSAPPTYYVTSGFQAFNDIQQQATRRVLTEIAQITQITFIEVAHDGVISFAMNRQSSNNAGYGYSPGYRYFFDGQNIITEVQVIDTAGDVWLASNKAWTTNDFTPDGSGYGTLIHEIGHALGLIHPFDGNNYILSDALNNTAYTIMSYTEHPNSLFRTVTLQGLLSYTSSYEYIDPETLMPYDILALQYLYGANTTYHTENNIYTFQTDRPFIKTIWDAGGTDTISVQNFTRGCLIDLGAGHYSSIAIPSDALPSWATETKTGIYDGTNNLAIAYQVLIENATGGKGNDQLLGNQLPNNLHGNMGNDTLNGGSGNDTLNGGAGSDIFVFDSLTGSDKIKNFQHIEDTIWLDHKIFTVLPLGALATSVFIKGMGYTTAQDHDDHFIYNTSNGNLYYDPDGIGGTAALLMVTLIAKPVLTADDMIIM